jgi:hypothetical protein
MLSILVHKEQFVMPEVWRKEFWIKLEILEVINKNFFYHKFCASSAQITAAIQSEIDRNLC